MWWLGYADRRFYALELALLGSGQEQTYLGPAVAYHRLQQTIGLQIANADAAEVRRWINEAVLPSIQHSPEELGEDACLYFDGRTDLSSTESREIQRQIDDVVADRSVGEVRRIKAILHIVLVHKGRRYVKTLVSPSRMNEPHT